MLTYQDCLELKEAGFPQGEAGEDCSFYTAIDSPIVTLRMPFYVKRPDYLVRCPTLSELLEACGEEEWFNLHFYPGYQGENKWEAKQSNPEFDETLKPEDEEFVALGSSPEQAVKNLYCALNPKK